MNTKGKNYDSEFCGSLPLHNINLIQPYGYLLVLGEKDLSIIQTSENIVHLLGLPANQLLNSGFSTYISQSEAESLQLRASSGITEKTPLHLTIKNEQGTERHCIAIVHTRPEYLILEVEEAEIKKTFIDVFQEIKFSMAAIELASTVNETCEAAIKELKKLSGFDKVMMYRFDKNWNGTVIAEASDDGLDPYLGLTFPASDIPKQARDLYLKNAYRLIPSREYTPVRLYPVRNPATNTFLDLSDCNLRSVPAVHLEYLSNMNVMSSMSTRVIVNEQLWGLIACHHNQEKNLSYEERSVFELLSSVISAKISSIQNKERFDFKNSLRDKRVKLSDQVYTESNLSKGLLRHSVNIMSLLNAGGAAVIQNGQLETLGRVPNEEDIRNLILWLQNKRIETVYAETSLSSIYDDAGNYADIASGIIAIPVNAGRGDYVITFRPEVVTTINWGGNPEEAINFETDKKKYHPRNSFRLWKETVSKTSMPWHNDEIVIAEEMRTFIFEFSSKYIYN